ncbi:MAG: glycerate kinase type-2 family protein [Cyclonatronaceae bacterium]
MSSLRAEASDIFRLTLSSMKPEKLVRRALQLKDDMLRIDGELFSLNNRPVYVLGAGKAAARMAAGTESVLQSYIRDGLVIGPEAGGAAGPQQASLERIQLFSGTHPKPDESSLASTLELMKLARSIPEEALVLVLISGGASSLMEAPAGRLELPDVRQTYDTLLRSGATIQEMNTVRKQLSAVKGGKLLNMLKARDVVSLIISDVPGDDPAFIASGPTTPDQTTRQDALDIIQKHHIEAGLPGAVLDFLKQPEPARETRFSGRHHSCMVGTSKIFAEEAALHARAKGYKTEVADKAYNAPAEEVAGRMLRSIPKIRLGKKAFIFHGESTIQVSGDGKGGRNQHIALLLAEGLAGKKDVLALSAGTDGIDGNVPVAGAFTDGETLARARGLGLDIHEYKANFDSYHFFKSLNELIITGPTGNNVMDFQLILCE